MAGSRPEAERDAARAGLAETGVRVLLEDNHVLVVSKPAGVLSQGGPAGERPLTDLLDAYRRRAEGKPGRAYVGLVHRLDRNVSGVLVVAKTSKAAARLSAAFRDRAEGLVKTYLAWVAGIPEEEEGSIESRLRRSHGVTRETLDSDASSKPALLRYAIDGRGGADARLRVELHTGVTHQIRAQLAATGLPLHGDEKYRGPPGPRPALHAWRLAFPHPVGGEPVEVVAPVPEDLRALDRSLGIRPPFPEVSERP